MISRLFFVFYQPDCFCQLHHGNRDKSAAEADEVILYRQCMSSLKKMAKCCL